MSSSSLSENRRSNERAKIYPDLITMESMLLSLCDETDSLETEVNKIKSLKKEISDLKWVQINKTELTKEKIYEMSKGIGDFGKRMVYKSKTHIKKMMDDTKPYISSDVASGDKGLSSEMTKKCSELNRAIEEIQSTMKNNDKIMKTVLHDQKLLDRLEATQRNAVDRYEKLIRIKRLFNEYPEGSHLHELIVLANLLLSLESSNEISGYYQNKFGKLEGRIESFLASISDHVPSKIGNISSYFSTQSLSNGEIDLQSIIEPNEIPIDSTEIPVSSH